ncbi:MAG: hypothetical protein M3Q08_01085 [Pseudomonadota bacterium]|nr:hypothetical protein [Pseudomonadota bacterium]
MAKWRITLGDGRKFSDKEWTAIPKEERQNLLVRHPGSRFDYLRAHAATGADDAA